jgi:hypothetical protein
MQQVNQTIEKEEISIREIADNLKSFWRYLISKWKEILVFALVGASLGLVLSLLTAPMYKGELTFVIESKGGSKLGGYGGLAAQFGLNLGEGGGMFQEEDNIIALLNSRTLVARTLLSDVGNGTELLVDRYIAANNLREKWKSKPQLAQISFHDHQLTILHDSLLTLFHKNLLKNNIVVAKPDKKLDIISITTTSTDEIFAKTFTEKLLENVTNFYVETQTKKQQENVNILRHKADSVRILLNSAISGVAISSDANPNLNPALQRLRIPSQRRMIDVEMNKAILTELVKNLEISEITLRKETPLVQVIDRPVLPLEKKKLGKLKGLVFGFLLGAGLTIVFLSTKRYLKLLLS